ncbi:MAG: M28 family peptidase [Hymenobacter sp.]
MPAGYKAEYGILFDMVGAKNARFTREGSSLQQARPVVDKIWSTAAKLGYSDFFLYQDTGPITDDHVYTTQAGVPTVDIYDRPPFGGQYFPPYHHTTDDNMSIIDRKTFKAVGQTVLQVLYEE